MFWLREEKNNPGVLEHYLMMVGAEVRRTRVKNPKEVSLQDLRVEFEWQDTPEQQQDVSPEELHEYSNWLKQAMLARWKQPQYPGE